MLITVLNQQFRRLVNKESNKSNEILMVVNRADWVGNVAGRAMLVVKRQFLETAASPDCRRSS